MREVRRLTAADARRQPWKNGRGVTEELAVWPAGAARDDCDWRIARAAVDEAGPFSAFPGFERVLVVTQGAGLLLDHGAAAPPARVGLLQPYLFSGDWPTSAALIDGRVADFNVLARRGVVRADVVVLRPGAGGVREALRGGPAFVHVVSGGVAACAGGASPVALAAGESLWVRGGSEAASLELAAAPDAAVIFVRMD